MTLTALTLQQLIDAGIHPTQARLFIDPIIKYSAQFEFASPPRLAGWLGQARYETNGLTQLEELLSYRSADHILETFRSHVVTLAKAQTLVRNPKALANCVYANRYGNGDEASGDGWKFRGRGCGQLTFQANYAHAGERAGRDWIARPDELLDPDGAVLSFAIYYYDHGCNEMADASNWDAITAAINPAMLGAAERRSFTLEALDAFHAQQ